MNEIEKAFLERIAELKIEPGPGFAALTKGALEGEWGGEADELLKGISGETLEDPKRLASELIGTYGDGAERYLLLIVKYADSGRFHPDAEQELEKEEEELESVVEEVDANSGQEDR